MAHCCRQVQIVQFFYHLNMRFWLCRGNVICVVVKTIKDKKNLLSDKIFQYGDIRKIQNEKNAPIDHPHCTKDH